MSKQGFTHQEVEALLTAYVTNELNYYERAQVAYHIQRCPRCQNSLAEVKHIYRLLSLLALPERRQYLPLASNDTYIMDITANMTSPFSSIADSVVARLDEPISPTEMPFIPALPHDLSAMPDKSVHRSKVARSIQIAVVSLMLMLSCIFASLYASYASTTRIGSLPPARHKHNSNVPTVVGTSTLKPDIPTTPARTRHTRGHQIILAGGPSTAKMLSKPNTLHVPAAKK